MSKLWGTDGWYAPRPRDGRPGGRRRAASPPGPYSGVTTEAPRAMKATIRFCTQ